MSAIELESTQEDKDKNVNEEPSAHRGPLSHIGRLLLTTLALGWVFDFLFWMKAPGISFAILCSYASSPGWYWRAWKT